MSEHEYRYAMGAAGSNLPVRLLAEYAKRNMDIIAEARGGEGLHVHKILVRKHWDGSAWTEVR